jgi:hypothetical protein
MKCYKLTDENGQTCNDTQWGEGVTHEAPGKGPLCTNGWIHAYSDPYLAVFMNPVHANFANPVLWEANAEGEIKEEQTKLGCQKLTTRCKIDLPEISTDQRIEISIRCAMLVYEEPEWLEWANGWLTGNTRSARAAAATAARAAWAAEAAAATAAWTAEAAAAAAARAAWAARAARAAEAAARAAVDIDIVSVIREVVGVHLIDDPEVSKAF